ncbi:aldehyde dehydrogenase, dimeric NADP-preferring isoform X1 [Spodoptera frugiperda]|uniref:Aldehyde dehydrogenase, dimeric NADP-preferring isoform X1 n=2 Tax=Spodoptera frugiperda TaxID=7108 RepID=A0A9R0EHX0_SPOFR|nr:aldehyde dehydrogenase, dimeric NADP-preferring isoform X1 [Spodoptera frugiperda]
MSPTVCLSQDRRQLVEMPAPTGQDASAKNSDVHVIDIDLDVDQVVAPIDKSDIPVIHIDRPKQMNTNTMNGNGIANSKPKQQNVAEAVERARDAYNRGVTRPLKWRLQQLKNLLRMYEENQNAMIEALRKDLRRSKMESVMLEVAYLINDLRSIIHNLEDWAKPEKPEKGFVNMLDDVVIYHDPYGVALVIGAWNYPLQLLLLPMSGAIAGGNAVIVKPSELATACAAFVAEMVPKYLDNDAIIVVEGGPQETTELLKQKFDYIFFTGGTSIGKIVYEAAVKNLTPVTLELGGKSPVYIDNTADIMITTKRVLWGKFINAGQTCIAPDYILCTKETQDKFVAAAKKVLQEWYGPEPQKSPDFARIINSRHFSRLQALVDASKDKIAIGGSYDANDKFVELTVLTNVVGSDKIMQDEIFGPILPIVPVENAYEAIKFINEREKPLVLYVFSKSDKVLSQIVDNTSSGGMCVNDTMMHLAVESLPFGGVGASGLGAYHGKKTFETFTHKKSCLIKNFSPIGEKLASGRYPPYTDGNLKMLNLLLRKRFGPSLKFLPYLLCFAVGAGLSYGIFAWQKALSEDS